MAVIKEIIKPPSLVESATIKFSYEELKWLRAAFGEDDVLNVVNERMNLFPESYEGVRKLTSHLRGSLYKVFANAGNGQKL